MNYKVRHKEIGMNSLKARIFISCGQRKGTLEEKIAQDIYAKFKELGYEPYLAVEEQTLKGLKENIFTSLDKSEYFLFIDFKREKIIDEDGKRSSRRGSLFSHQELAIASFLDKKVLAFQEEGAKKDDGIMKFIQANCISFKNKEKLLISITEEVLKRRWNPAWRDELIFERVPQQYSDEIDPHRRRLRYFHVNVRNVNPYKDAFNCCVYLESIINLRTKNKIPIETIEYKWRGCSFPYVLIAAGSYRQFDTFIVYHDEPFNAISSNLSDGSQYHTHTIKGPGEFELTFKVISQNFPTALVKFIFHLDDNINKVSLIEKPNNFSGLNQ